MEENEILDPADNPCIQRHSMKKKHVQLFLFLSSTFLFLLFYGCALPKIILLEDPLTPEEHVNLGVAYEKKGELDLAIKEYKKAAERLPEAFLYLGNAYYHKNELDEAERYYKKAIKEEPNNADTYNNLAWLYFTQRKNLKEAESLVLRAIELNPPDTHIYLDTLNKIRTLRESYE